MNKIIHGDALEVLRDIMPRHSVDCIITSPPYWNLRDYDHPDQLGNETTVQEYIIKLCDIFGYCMSVLKPEGTCFVNLNDTFAGSHKGAGTDTSKCLEQYIPSVIPKAKAPVRRKSLCGIPERFMVEMLNRGWILRNKIVWNKPNAKPQPALDKFVPSWEAIYFFVLNPKHYFKKQFEPVKQSTIERANRRRNADAKYAFTGQLEPKQATHRGMRDVFHIATASPKGIPHLAMYPKKLVNVLINAGCPEKGIVLDPFVGSGTTAITAKEMGRAYIGIDTNPTYIDIATKRLTATPHQLPLLSV